MLDNKDVKKIIDALKSVFATKKDLQAFATKKDLQRFATKKDLEALPTAKMMNDSFNNIESRMATKEQVQKIDDRLKVVEEKLTRLDGIPERVRITEDALGID